MQGLPLLDAALQGLGLQLGDGSFQATHLFLTSQHTTPEALLQLVGALWSIECWHWIHDTHLKGRVPTALMAMELVHSPACELQRPTCCGWLVFSRAALGCRP